MPEITSKVIDRLFDKMDSIETQMNEKFSSIETELRAHMALDADSRQYNRMKLEEIEKNVLGVKATVKTHGERLDGHDRIVWQVRGMWVLIGVITAMQIFGNLIEKFIFGG